MKKFKSICKVIDTWFNKFVQKGSESKFLEYTVKYLIACGIGFNLVLTIIILLSIFK
jgi:hypothetical protein